MEWLRCDGAAYSRTTYSKLFAKIGTTYGIGNGSSTFNVPNLMNYFVRCWDGSSAFNTVQQDQVGVHNHSLSGNVGSESSHTHTRGTMNITGSISKNNSQDIGGGTGAFGNVSGAGSYSGGANSALNGYSVIQFNAANSWTGTTSAGSSHTHSLNGLSTANNSTGTTSNETRVLNKMLVPMIKY